MPDTATTTMPPDDRLDGPVHTWFGLSYSNYAVLHRTLMQSMPEEWQERMVECLEELDAAFQHAKKADWYLVRPAVEREYRDLSEADMKRLGIERADVTSGLFYDADGGEHEYWERVLVPAGDDPVPAYNRGRTYIEPCVTTVAVGIGEDGTAYLDDGTEVPAGGWELAKAEAGEASR